MPIVNWDETCSKCVFGSTETRVKNSKGRCTNKCPIIHFDPNQHAWICGSFKRRWDTPEDLELSKNEDDTHHTG